MDEDAVLTPTKFDIAWKERNKLRVTSDSGPWLLPVPEEGYEWVPVKTLHGWRQRGEVRAYKLEKKK